MGKKYRNYLQDYSALYKRSHELEAMIAECEDIISQNQSFSIIAERDCHSQKWYIKTSHCKFYLCSTNGNPRSTYDISSFIRDKLVELEQEKYATDSYIRQYLDDNCADYQSRGKYSYQRNRRNTTGRI